MKRILALSIALAFGACDARKPPPDDKAFERLMEETQRHFKAEVTVYLCNRPAFGAHATDKTRHLTEPRRNLVLLRFEEYDLGFLDPEADVGIPEETFKRFRELGRQIVRFPKREGEEQLIRRVKVDADPEVPVGLLDRVEMELKGIGVRTMSRSSR